MFKLITPARFAACLVYAFNPRGSFDCSNTLAYVCGDVNLEDECDVLDAIHTLDQGMSELRAAHG